MADITEYIGKTLIASLINDTCPTKSIHFNSVMVDDTENVPGLSCTTWPAGQLSIAAWILAPGESVAQTVVRSGRPSAPRGKPSCPSDRISGFQAVIRSAAMRSVIVTRSVIVRVAVPGWPLKAAVMVAVPAATPVARPLLTIVAVAVLDELQVTCVVISWVVDSEYVPVAVNCWVAPTTILTVAGVTAVGACAERGFKAGG